MTSHGISGWGNRMPFIHRCKLISVFACRLLVRCLYRCGLRMSFPHESILLCGRPCSYTPGAIEAGAIIRPVVIHIPAIDIGIMYNCCIDVHNSSIVAEVVILPPAAIEAGTTVSIPIVHAAIVSDIPSPITMMKTVITSGESPITWSP